MSNKNIIEEKADAIIEEMHQIEDLPVTEEQAWRMLRAALTKALTEVAAHQQARNIEAVERILEDTLAADGFVGFKMDEWRACKVFTKLICARVTAALRSQHLSERQTFEVVEAPGDRCGNTRKLADGTACPGCRACQ